MPKTKELKARAISRSARSLIEAHALNARFNTGQERITMAFFGGNEKINAIAEITAKSGFEDAVRAVLTSLVEPSRKEKGCRQYHLLEDKKKPGSFWTYEEWDSEAALNEHLIGAKQMLAQVETLLDGALKLTVLEHLV